LCSGGKKKTLATKPQATFELNAPLKLGKFWQEQYSRETTEAKKPYIADLMALADQRISNLNREINVLKGEKVQQSESIATLMNKVYCDIYFKYTLLLLFFLWRCSPAWAMASLYHEVS
jgi:hypothetical protein